MNPNQGAYAMSIDALMAGNTFANGAILIDEFDPVIFDDFSRKFPAWEIVDKRPAVGDFTNAFIQTALGTARVADKRSLSFSATSPTRTTHSPQEIKALVRDISFGLYDRSVYAQQGKKFGDLTAKDVKDVYTSLYDLWNGLFYEGDISNGSGFEFNGLKKLLGAADPCLAAKSVVKFIQEKVVTMMNSSPKKDVRPTHIFTNARVRQLCAQEYRKVGDRMPDLVGTRGEKIDAIDTAAGMLPLVVDSYCGVIAATPMKYPLFLISADKVAWNYIEPLGQAGADAKMFEFVMTNTVDSQYKGLMFGALDLYGGTDHNAYCTIEDRAAAVDMST